MLIPEIDARRNEIDDLCRRLGVRRLEVFGSAARGAFHSEDSDLDFLVEFETTEPGSGYANRYFDLLESLQELFDRPVDLVIASAVRNPFFRESVDRTKTLLYAA